MRSTTGKNGKQIKPAGRSACILTPHCPGRTTEFVDWSR